MVEDYQDLLHRVRAIAEDLFGMPASEVEEFIDELRDAGIAFKEISS